MPVFKIWMISPSRCSQRVMATPPRVEFLPRNPSCFRGGIKTCFPWINPKQGEDSSSLEVSKVRLDRDSEGGWDGMSFRVQPSQTIPNHFMIPCWAHPDLPDHSQLAPVQFAVGGGEILGYPVSPCQENTAGAPPVLISSLSQHLQLFGVAHSRLDRGEKPGQEDGAPQIQPHRFFLTSMG